MDNKVDTIFIGSGNFAAELFPYILAAPELNLKAVVTQPDRPVGRHQELQACAAWQAIEQTDFSGSVYKPEKLKDEAEQILNAEKPDLIIVADYGQMIPKIMLEYPKFKCINVHGSILPDLRGAVPIPMAILKGYTETGVSIPIMTPGLDDGPVIAERKLQINQTDTTYTLTKRLARLAGELIQEVLPKWVKGELKATEQNHERATFTQKSDLHKEKAYFMSKNTPIEVESMVRAYYPWPIAWTHVNFGNKKLRLKVFEAKASELQIASTKEILYKEGKIYLGLQNGNLELTKMQLEGKVLGGAGDYEFLKSIAVNLVE